MLTYAHRLTLQILVISCCTITWLRLVCLELRNVTKSYWLSKRHFALSVLNAHWWILIRRSLNRTTSRTALCEPATSNQSTSWWSRWPQSAMERSIRCQTTQEPLTASSWWSHWSSSHSKVESCSTWFASRASTEQIASKSLMRSRTSSWQVTSHFRLWGPSAESYSMLSICWWKARPWLSRILSQATIWSKFWILTIPRQRICWAACLTRKSYVEERQAKLKHASY